MHFDSSCSHVSTAAVIKAKDRDLDTNGWATGYQRQAGKNATLDIDCFLQGASRAFFANK